MVAGGGQGCAWLWGACVNAGGSVVARGMHGCEGVCMVARGRGHAWMQGVCMVAGGMHGGEGACMRYD